MKKNIRKVLSGAASAAMLIGGTQQIAQAETPSVWDCAPVEAQSEAASFKPVANVKGIFSFNQEQLTPSDEAFNLFGTVLTGMCAKPAFVFENSKADFYVNVGGKIRKSYSVNLNDMKDREVSRVMLCSCATGPASANVRATGIPVEDILQLAVGADDCNAVTFTGSDGYGQTLPLSYVLEKKALIVYKVNEAAVPSATQLFIPETVAKYFTRDVVDIELSKRDTLPMIDARDGELRANVAIMNASEGCAFALGDEITFEGYADDCGDPITAVEFSLDGGNTWTVYDTSGATADRWVYWNFSLTPDGEGAYQLSVRARTASDVVSPLAAKLSFRVAAQANEGANI